METYEGHKMKNVIINNKNKVFLAVVILILLLESSESLFAVSPKGKKITKIISQKVENNSKRGSELGNKSPTNSTEIKKNEFIKPTESIKPEISNENINPIDYTESETTKNFKKIINPFTNPDKNKMPTLKEINENIDKIIKKSEEEERKKWRRGQRMFDTIPHYRDNRYLKNIFDKRIAQPSRSLYINGYFSTVRDNVILIDIRKELFFQP